MGIGNRIKEARNNLGYTQEELAKLLGVTKGAVANYELNTSHPKEPIMYKLIEVLHIDANYLFQDCVNIPKELNNVTLSEYEYIRKYRALDDIGRKNVDVAITRETDRIKALDKLRDFYINGSTVENQYTNKSGQYKRIYSYLRKIACAGTGFTFEEIPTDQIQAPYMEDADFIIGVNGDSMEPDYHDGDKVYVKKADSLDIGEVGIFTVNHTCFIKELGQDGLISHNKKYENIPGTEDVRLIGKVIGKVNEN